MGWSSTLWLMVSSEGVGYALWFWLGPLAAGVAVACLAALWVATGCQTLEDAATWDISLHNDTSQSVVIRACKTSACNSFRYMRKVAAGRQDPATDYGDGRSWWLVLNDRGRRLGCLTLNYTDRVEGYVIRVSRLTSCPR